MTDLEKDSPNREVAVEAKAGNAQLATDDPETAQPATGDADTEAVARPSYLSFALMAIAATFGGLTQNIMNTALPALMADTGISISSGQLLTTVFPLCLGIVIPLVAFLSRRLSSKVLTMGALVMFLCGSLIIAVSSSFPLILLGRVLQALSTGILLPLVQVVVLALYPSEKWGLLMGIVGIAMGFAPNVGPTIGGAFTELLGWRSCFWFLSAFSALLLVVMLIWFQPRSIAEENPPELDWPSFLLSAVGFGCLLAGFSRISSVGIASPQAIVPIVVGIVSLLLFCYRELHIDNPMLELRCFKDHDFTAGTIMLCLLFCSFIGVTLVIPMHLQTIEGFTALESGMVLLPCSLVAAVMSPLSGAAVDRFGARPIVLIAGICASIGAGMLIDMGHCTDLGYIALAQSIRQVGIASLIMPLTVWSVRRLEGRMTADGTSFSNAIRQVAASLSTAVMVLLMQGGAPDGAATASGVNAAMTFSFVMALALLLIGIFSVHKEK